ncbi:hypothetical protein SAMN06265173_11520 [Thalassovita litoralis]|uniref:Uncharacterized protein n=1 Tax=Thalassovita litoralis TaxID=1010611 RepID=A0A521E924_9RHOB|nr:hypothetical protein SAMN06265173_11520 [Thalassovita litoralis]
MKTFFLDGPELSYVTRRVERGDYRGVHEVILNGLYLLQQAEKEDPYGRRSHKQVVRFVQPPIISVPAGPVKSVM